VFIEAGAPTEDELHALLHTLITRLMKMLTRQSAPLEDMGQTYPVDADGEAARTLRPLQAATINSTKSPSARAG
jgi:hypothetical protein